MRRAADRTVTKWKTGTARKRRSQVRKFESPPDDPGAQSDNGSGPSGAFFMRAKRRNLRREERAPTCQAILRSPPADPPQFPAIFTAPSYEPQNLRPSPKASNMQRH